MSKISPKTTFLHSRDAKVFADIAERPELHRAIEASLAEMQLSPGKTSDAASNWHRLEGAKQFIDILLNIAEIPTKTKRGAPRENLKP